MVAQAILLPAGMHFLQMNYDSGYQHIVKKLTQRDPLPIKN
jgi:hypothetical protein